MVRTSLGTCCSLFRFEGSSHHFTVLYEFIIWSIYLSIFATVLCRGFYLPFIKISFIPTKGVHRSLVLLLYEGSVTTTRSAVLLQRAHTSILSCRNVTCGGYYLTLVQAASSCLVLVQLTWFILSKYTLDMIHIVQVYAWHDSRCPSTRLTWFTLSKYTLDMIHVVQVHAWRDSRCPSTRLTWFTLSKYTHMW